MRKITIELDVDQLRDEDTGLEYAMRQARGLAVKVGEALQGTGKESYAIGLSHFTILGGEIAATVISTSALCAAGETPKEQMKKDVAEEIRMFCDTLTKVAHEAIDGGYDYAKAETTRVKKPNASGYISDVLKGMF